MKYLEDRAFGIAGVLAILALGSVIAYYAGERNGEAKSNRTMWENPPNMAWCRVYPDGGKRCEKYAELAPKPLIECLRQCRMSDRMNKTGSPK